MGWGDELMVTGQARVAQERDPRKVRIVYERPRFHESWFYNPRIAGKDEKGDFQELIARRGYLRPYIAEKGADRWAWRRYRPPRGELYFSAEEQTYGDRHRDRVVLEPHIKAGASPNKDWGWVRWSKLARLLSREGVRVAQLGPAGLRSLDGVERIHTPTMRAAAAVLAQARAAALPEGGLHHVAAAVGTPAVVIFGGYISPEVTGYEGQASLFVKSGGHELGCGMRSVCAHCREAMAAITPETVCDRLMEFLNVQAPGHLAA